MNHLKGTKSFRNRYFLMRHGWSEANERNLVLSSPEQGLFSFGLTKKGKEQVRDSVRKINALNSKTIIVSSDFLRTRETAELVRELIESENVILSEKIRERFFGDFDNKTPGEPLYRLVWDHDEKSPDKPFRNVESLSHLLDRVTSLIADLEKEYSDETILIVSHGDPLNILLDTFSETPCFHDKSKRFHVAEIKELKLQ